MENNKSAKKAPKKKCRIDDNGRECTKCGTYKAWDDYPANSNCTRGKNPACKVCHAAKSKEYHHNNKEQIAVRRNARYSNLSEEDKSVLMGKNKVWKAKNPDKVRAGKKRDRESNAGSYAVRSKRWKLANKDYCSEYSRAYREENVDAINLYRAANQHLRVEHEQKRRASKLQAMPAWADRQAITDIVKETQVLTAATGTPYHLDHIIPLRHPLVCGLHIPSNLKPVLASTNLRKSNKFDSDLYAAHSNDLDGYYVAILGEELELA